MKFENFKFCVFTIMMYENVFKCLNCWISIMNYTSTEWSCDGDDSSLK